MVADFTTTIYDDLDDLYLLTSPQLRSSRTHIMVVKTLQFGCACSKLFDAPSWMTLITFVVKFKTTISDDLNQLYIVDAPAVDLW